MQTKEAEKTIAKIRQQRRMKIWMLSIDTFNYTEFHLPNIKDRQFFNKLCVPRIIQGQEISEIWKPLVFIKKRQKQTTDFTFIEDIGIAISKKAMEALTPLIEHSVEILTLRTTADTPFFFVHTKEAIDALKEEETIFSYSSVSKTKIGIEKFVFDKEKIKNKHFFKINDFWYNTYISDEFRAIYKQHKLRGLDFTPEKLIWKQ